MPVEIRVPDSPHGNRLDGPQIVLASVVLLGAAAFAFAAWTFPAPLVLPAFSVIAIIIASCVALLAWTLPQRFKTERVTYWDIAGALTFIGICSALLSDAQQVMPLLEARRTP